MKNKYFILAGILLIAGSLLTGCENNRENAKEKVKQANQEMVDAQAQFDKEWQQFKSDAELKINANQKNIDDFKAAMKTTSKKFRAKYENQVLTLEQKNIELKKNLNEYQYVGKDNWDKFKQDFNNNMDSVGNALKSIFEKKN
ncbi:MAG: sll1863 family stress response protein [Ignavibacteriaceae bacterium]